MTRRRWTTHGGGLIALLAVSACAGTHEPAVADVARTGHPREDIPHPSGQQRTHVFGTMGQVRWRNEATFLARFDDSWRIMAASCQATRPGQPYDCKVKGS